ncbi:unnamed protein product [Brachionus calyciflorus]|uniref:Uncharacterized protein n=1 Tax=Brachionus calyciflorus TaxID=104777 RepID=A0A814NUK7_9BILA|nr:unnamed protein product [Brachionus calyciflorus]
MKTIYCLLISMSVILAHSLVKSEQLNESQNNIDDFNERQLTRDEIKARILNLLISDSTLDYSDSNEQEDFDSGINKRMTYRYGKRMTYRYGKKRSAMPYRFGKRSYNFDDNDFEELLRLYKIEEPKYKRMTYRYGRSVDKQ